MKRFMRLFLLTLFVLQFATFWPQIRAWAEDEIKIGCLLPETGSLGWIKVAYSGIDLAVKEINDAGGPLGRKIVTVRRDTGSVADQSRKGMEDLIYNIKVPAVIGPTSATILEVLDIAQKEHVVEISPTAGTTKLDTIGGKWVFRTTSSDKVMGLGIAVEAMILGFKKAAVFCANTGSGTSMAGAVKPHFTRLGGRITEEIIFEEGKSSYREELKRLFKGRPDVIFFEASPPEGKIIFKEWNEMGLGGTWIGTDFFNEEFVEKVSAVANIEGLMSVRPSPAPSERLERWKRDLNALTGAEGIPAFSAQAYDAVNLIALAIEAAGQATGEGIASKLRMVGDPPGREVYNFAEGARLLRRGEDIDYIGVAGKIEFDEYGDVMVDHQVNQVKRGKLVQIGVLTQDELAQYAK